MFDPVKLFNDLATANSLQFIYGAEKFANWEITQKDLSSGDMFLAMFPFEERGTTDNGSVSKWNVSTIIWVGAKFDPALTFSNLDETEKQKYDRRLKTFSAMIQILLDNLCASEVELIDSPRRFRELNKFDENTDVVACELSFSYDVNQVNAAPPPPVVNAGTNMAATSFIASWNKNRATGYYLDVATDALMANLIINSEDVGNVSYKLVSGLTTHTDYWYRVCAYNSSGISGASAIKKITTL